MKVLLTGANGNLGRALIRRAGFEIMKLGREGWNDLDATLSRGVDAVIHAASDLITRPSASPTRLLDSNVLATARLLEAARKHSIQRFVFISSCAVYGEDMRTHELAPCFPISVNGITKLLNERVVGEFCSKNGIKYEILRVFNMYGGDDHFSVFSHVERALENGTPFNLNNEGIAFRDFIHVSDVADMILLLLRKDVPYTHLNIGTGIAARISDLMALIKSRFPDISIRHNRVAEAEYSRADISRLSELVECKFIRVEDYLMNEFMQEKHGQSTKSNTPSNAA